MGLLAFEQASVRVSLCLALLGSVQLECSSHPTNTNLILFILQDTIYESWLPRVLYLKLITIATL